MYPDTFREGELLGAGTNMRPTYITKPETGTGEIIPRNRGKKEPKSRDPENHFIYEIRAKSRNHPLFEWLLLLLSSLCCCCSCVVALLFAIDYLIFIDPGAFAIQERPAYYLHIFID